MTDLTGTKVGHLTVLYRDTKAEAERKTAGKTPGSLWKCQCDCGALVTVSKTKLTTHASFLRSCEKCGYANDPDPEHQNKSNDGMTAEEITEWNRLYEYVKKLLGYTEEQKLSKTSVLRLKGLATGKYIANKRTPDQARYPFRVIRLTFADCRQDIERALARKQFPNETAKLNYICRIVENNINTFWDKLRSQERSEKHLKERDWSHLDAPQADYQNKSQELPSWAKEALDNNGHFPDPDWWPEGLG